MRKATLSLAVSFMVLGMCYLAPPVLASAVDPFLAEIDWVGFNFAPRGWALCNGQILPINQNQALFALLGTQFGGNGQTTFALPNLQGRFPLHQGTGPGGAYVVGQQGGEATHTLTEAEIPSHTHIAKGSSAEAYAVTPTGNAWASKSRTPLYSTGSPDQQMNPGAIAPAGSGQPHNNMPPFTTLNCIIALQGVFPSQN